MSQGQACWFWASRDHAILAPDWAGPLKGISYSPSVLYDEADVEAVSPGHIRADLKQLSEVTGRIRTYTVAHGLDRVPEIAAQYGLKVSLGIWIGPDKEANDKEIDTAVVVALNNRRTVDSIIVGNEAVLRGDVTVTELSTYIARVRRLLPRRIQVSTAEFFLGHLAEKSRARQTGRFHRRAHPSLLGRHPGQPGAGRAENTLRDDAAAVSLQTHPDCGNRLAFRRPHQRVCRSLGGRPSLLYPQLHLPGGRERTTIISLSRSYDQPWKGADEGAVGAPIGDCTTPTAMRNSPSPAGCVPSPNGVPMPAPPRC